MGTAPRKGFNLARKVGGAPVSGGLNAYKIASGYATALGVGDAVKLTTDGTLIKAANSAGNLGVINSIKYKNSAGEIKIDKYWPASTTATEIEVLVSDDPLATYHVLADGPIPETTFFPGQIYAMNLTAADSATGRSQMTVNTIPTITGDVDLSAVTTLVGAVSGMADGDAFTIKTTNPANSAVTINIATATTKAQLLAALNAVAGISASVAASTGFLTIQATDGYYITTTETTGNPITDLFAVASHTAAGTKVVAIGSGMVKVVSIPDRDNRVMEVALTSPSILADS
jgi:hypothetical protein